MSYKNLVAQPFATRAEVFKRFRDWMCKRNGSYDYSVTGLGWTLHDSSYATNENTLANNDYFVIKSVGESGKEDLYFKVTYSATSGNIQIQMFQYWNNTTHVGVNGMTASNNWQVPESTAGTLYIYGDLDTICCLTLSGTSYYGCVFGLVNDSEYDRTIATSSGAVAAGSNVVVTVDAVPVSWVVGGKVVVRDNANIARIIISAIDGLNVTFTSLVASYSAGCKFAKDYPVACSTINNVGGGYAVLFGHNNTKIISVSSVPNPVMPGVSGSPDALDGEYLCAPYELGGSGVGYYGRFKNILGMSTTGFVHLSVYQTEGGDSYRAFNQLYSSFPVLLKEV